MNDIGRVQEMSSNGHMGNEHCDWMRGSFYRHYAMTLHFYICLWVMMSHRQLVGISDWTFPCLLPFNCLLCGSVDDAADKLPMTLLHYQFPSSSSFSFIQYPLTSSCWCDRCTRRVFFFNSRWMAYSFDRLYNIANYEIVWDSQVVDFLYCIFEYSPFILAPE